jgi:SIR2-like domain
MDFRIELGAPKRQITCKFQWLALLFGSMDIAATDIDFLAKNATSNSVVLFLGAGFSSDAKNRLDRQIPVGSAFAKSLWEFLKYPGDYDNTALATMYEAALTRKHSELQRLLDETFLCTSIPSWYQSIAKLFWTRIYTTNVDNVVEEVYKLPNTAQRMVVIDGIRDDYRERNQFLEDIQCVKLNGVLTDKPTSITFSTSQYAARLADAEPWYDQFVRDYSTKCTVFIGTKLDEPLFWQAVAARGKRFSGGEPRPKSFIIAPSFSPAQVETLKDFHVIAITGTAKEFFDTLISRIGTLPTLEDVVLKANPGLDALIRVHGARLSARNRGHIEAYYRCFRPVKSAEKKADYRSYFLLGTEPRWEDIGNDFDAPREFTSTLVADVQSMLKVNEVSLIAITGSAGSGKSTVLMRAATSLVAAGNLVFYTNSEELPALHDFEGALELLPRRSVITFDSASLAAGILPDYLAAAKRCPTKHIFIIAARTNTLAERLPVYKNYVTVKEYQVPDLTLSDIDSIIDTLERKHLLGRLANMPRNQQREVFLSYAHNQILVAMRRATLGPGFDDIIKSEFLTAEPLEAKFLYLCASLVTDAQFTITKQQMIACVDLKPADTLGIIRDNLRGVLIPTASNSDRYAARHRVIAGLILSKVAPRGMLKDAYVRFLKALSHDLPFGERANSAAFRLFRRIINHAHIYERFAEHLSEARGIYAAVAPYFSRDYHFWLQFGSLELEYGELASAANYIEQAYKYAPNDNIVITTRAQLIYKQSLEVTVIEQAREMRNEAKKTLLEQMSVRAQDNYPFHIYCTQELAWIHRWVVGTKEKIEELEMLRSFGQECVKTHANSIRLKQAVALINSAYLDLAKPGLGGGAGFNPIFG